jgi:hemerythrin-like domain-containing protein
MSLVKIRVAKDCVFNWSRLEVKMKLYNSINRRSFIGRTAVSGAGLILGSGLAVHKTFAQEQPSSKGEASHMEMEVTATEDLMREHGVLRRILIVYSECARRIRDATAAGVYEPINQAAQLFRQFGENYHEKLLEEAYIFPAVSRAGGQASAYPEILIAQHRRGWEITGYISSATNGKEPADAPKLARAMEAFVRMYRAHAAREDTVVFPAWKQTMSEEQLNETGEKFEQIEHKQFGEDGFEKAVSQIAAIETHLGLADLSQFTAPPMEA